MKLIAFLLLGACLQVSAIGYSQKISLEEKNVPLQKVFKAIHKQTGYSFFYEDELLNKKSRVTIIVKDGPLEEVLALCLQNLPVTWSIINKAIVIKSKEEPPITTAPDPTGPPPPIDVKGRIFNDKGEPVLVTISVKGTKIITTTNEKGEFELKGIETNAVLVITGVNIQSHEVKVNGRTNLPVSVRTRIQSQDEVVVTALGVEKTTKEIGYSVAKVTGEEINRTSPSNLLTGLTAKVSGLNIATQGAGMNPQMKVLLRGIRSISSGANNAPLIILNGSPISFGNSQQAANIAIDFMNNLNPNDIDNVSVLKGANATALYGPEGVNGVIVITTKKGNKGGKATINASTSTTFSRVDFRPFKMQKQFGAGNSTDQYGNPVYDPTAMGGWGPAYDGKEVQIGRPDQQGNIQTAPYQYTNERRKFWDVARLFSNNVSILAGDARQDFYMSIAHQSQTGILQGDKKNFANVLLRAGRQVGKFTVSVTGNYSQTKLDEGNYDYKSLELTPGHVPLSRYKNWQTDKWSDPDHYWSDYHSNPYMVAAMQRKTTNISAFFGALETTWKPLPWLTVLDRVTLITENFRSKDTGRTVPISEWAKFNGFIRFRSGQEAAAGMKEEFRNLQIINNDLLVRTANSVGAFSFKTTSGVNIKETFIKRTTINASQLAVPVFHVDFARQPPAVTDYYELSRNVSLFTQVLTGYKDRVFLELTARNDWDSKLAKVARRKNLYFGANAAFILEQIFPGLQEWKWLDNAKVRAAVTRTANMNVKPFQFERILSRAGGFPYQMLIGYDYAGGNPNPNLKPETIISQEYGFAFSLLKGRIAGDVTYYYQRNKGMILNVNNSVYSGAPGIDNAGTFDNFGWEFDLKGVSIIKTNSGFTLDLGARLAINDNKLVELSNAYNDELSAAADMGYFLVAKIGGHAYTYKVYDWKRDDAGRVVVDRNTGMPVIDYTRHIYRGRTLPKYIAGFDFTASYKRLSMYVLAQYTGEIDHFFAPQRDMLQNGFHPLTTQNNRKPFVFPNSVYHDGSKYVENTNVFVSDTRQGLYNLYAQASNHLLGSAAFWKIKEVAINYELPLKGQGGKKFNFSIYARDLFNFYPNSNITGDPDLVKGPGTDRVERQSSGGPNTQGEFGRDNTNGAKSELTRVPALVLYGAKINFSF